MKNIIEDEKYQRLIKMKVDFNKMSNTEKKAFIIERKGKTCWSWKILVEINVLF
jgi:hypothetical protein